LPLPIFFAMPPIAFSTCLPLPRCRHIILRRHFEIAAAAAAAHDYASFRCCLLPPIRCFR
jgi:hypothetical protein